MGDMERLDMGGERRGEDGVILKGHEGAGLINNDAILIIKFSYYCWDRIPD